MALIYVATSNPGKMREFCEAAQHLSFQLEPLPGLEAMQPPVEDGTTFEQNARIKAKYYSRMLPGELVLAEDSGLSVEELHGEPGVYSARYAATLKCGRETHENSLDQDNNAALIEQLERLSPGKHAGKYVCVIALARNGRILGTFAGEAAGELLTQPRGSGGFGYDPLFYFPYLGKTFAELPLDEKRKHSHRGKAIRNLLKALSEDIAGTLTTLG